MSPGIITEINEFGVEYAINLDEAMKQPIRINPEQPMVVRKRISPERNEMNLPMRKEYGVLERLADECRKTGAGNITRIMVRGEYERQRSFKRQIEQKKEDIELRIDQMNNGAQRSRLANITMTIGTIAGATLAYQGGQELADTLLSYAPSEGVVAWIVSPLEWMIEGLATVIGSLGGFAISNLGSEKVLFDLYLHTKDPELRKERKLCRRLERKVRFDY